MAHFHVKKKKGRPYLYVREFARIAGKPKVVSQVYIGSPERVRALVEGGAEEVRLHVQEFGALWLAARMDEEVDLAGIVDDIIPRGEREQGPTVGEYFLYAVLNRMIEATSKNKLAEWYGKTAVQQIRPVDLSELTSHRYWEKWDRVSEHDLERIGRAFFERVWKIEEPEADCLLFDTTNYYTFLASQTPSELARRGRNKDGRHHLRQIGLGLLVDRSSRLPLYYCVYPGNLHDSKLFGQVMDEMFGIVMGLDRTKERLTVVIDKGMNAEGNYAWIDEHARVHFVTSYSTYFSGELTAMQLERFEPVEIEKNRKLAEGGRPEERILAWRTSGEYWGRSRTVVVTYNPATARKQQYRLESKLESLRAALLEMRVRVREGEPHWRDEQVVRERYLRECERLHVPSDLYTLKFTHRAGKLSMSFRKDFYRLGLQQQRFGKSVIITDNRDWTTPRIVEAHLDRWKVENSFRLSKDEELVATRPVRHWTDSKLRCHLFTCVAAMTYLRMIERRLEHSGVQMTATAVVEQMRDLHSVLSIRKGARKPSRRLETPSKTQREVLRAFGCRIDTGGVLQQIES